MTFPAGAVTVELTASGARGPKGSQFLKGEGAPTSDIGNNGDFYFDTVARAIYGPKAAGAWGAGVSLVGATGPTGDVTPEAEAAAAAAALAAATAGAYPNSAASNVPRGAVANVLTPGSGGTNGTNIAATFTGGNYLGNPTILFDIVSGAVTNVRFVNPGLYIGAAPTAPTVVLPGAVGAALTLTNVFLIGNGSGYWVQSADGNTLDRYANVSGVATRDTTISSIASVPYLLSAISAAIGITTGHSGTPLLTMVGMNGRRWFSMGPMLIRHKQIDAHEVVAQNVGAGVVGRGYIPSVNYTGANGRRWYHATPDTIQHKQIDALQTAVNTLQGGSATLYKAMAVYAEIQHILIYGQSLAVGQNSGTPIGTTPLSYAKRSQAGVRSQDGGLTPATNWSSIVDLIETAGAQGGETIAYGMAKMFRQRMLSDTGIDIATLPQKLLFSAPGQGATAIAGLSDPSAPYTRLKTDLANAQATTVAGAKTWAPQALAWIQGESDYQAGTTALTWGTALQTLRTGVEAYGQGLTGDATMHLPLLMYQCASHINYGVAYPNIALEQLLLAQTDPYMAMATPCYHFPFASALDVHLSAIGYQWMGAYFGSALYDWLVNGVKPLPLAPLAIHRSGNTLLARFNVALGRKLSLDTTNVAAQTNYGLSVVDAGGGAQTISATPYFITADTIAIPCTNTPAAGWLVRNGFTGDAAHGLSNICDNNPLIYDAAGLNKTMWNHAAIFEKAVI